jgi:hypothetical protein
LGGVWVWAARLVGVFVWVVRLHQVGGPIGGRGGGGVWGEKDWHWRRGHWARVACGEGRAQRRLAFRKPVLVRADKFPGGAGDFTTIYG